MVNITKDRVVIKIRLKNILHTDINYSKLYKSISDTNKLINLGYLFTRSFMLHVIENNNKKNCIKIPEPVFNIDFIRLAFNVISCDEQSKRGRPFNGKKNVYKKILQDYFIIFRIKTDATFIKATNLSYILGQSYQQIHIAVINNIKYHYDKHLWKFIKANFDEEYKITKDKKQFWSELGKIKLDILQNTTKSNEKYCMWIRKNKNLIIPDTCTESKFDTDVEKNTFSYIKCMCHMNRYIQDKQLKSYQIFPIRTSIYQNYIKINTSALIDMFCKGDKLKYFKKSGDPKIQEILWNKYFHLKNSPKVEGNKYIYTREGFSFNYEIETDGFGVSLNFINNNDIDNKENYKKNKRLARKRTIDAKKNLSEEEYNSSQKSKQIKKDKNLEDQKNIVNDIKVHKRKEYIKKTKEEQDEIKFKLNAQSEFPYIEKLLINKENRELFKKEFDDGKIIVCDPGKKSILYLMSCGDKIHIKKNKFKMNNFGTTVWKGHKIMNYTNKTRVKFLKRQDYSDLVESWKKKTTNDKFQFELNIKKQLIKTIMNNSKMYYLDKKTSFDEKIKKIQGVQPLIDFLNKEIIWDKKSLKEIELELSELNSKSCKHDEFLEYVKKKLEYNKKVANQYDAKYLQKLKWFGYLNKNKHENALLNHIQNEFGSDINIVIGDWSNKGHIKFMSTPNIGIKRKLAERFKVYLIDEYLTSKLHYKHEVRCKNMRVKMESNEHKVKLHSVLSYKNEKQEMGSNKTEMGCINRDKNSVLNMEKIVAELIKTGKRPTIFSRERTRIDLKNKKVKLSDATAHIGNVKKNKTQKLNTKIKHLNKKDKLQPN